MTARAIELHGHRGARGLWPENTLTGILGAAAIGVSMIEVDVALTRDGVPVLNHDPILDPDLARGPDGAWISLPGVLIRNLTHAELGAYDVGRARPGSEAATSFPRAQGFDGVPLPRLADALAAAPEQRFAVELKTYPDHPDWTVPPQDMADAVLGVLEAAGAVPRVRVISFDWRPLRYLARRSPGLGLGYLTDAETVGGAALWWGGVSAGKFGGSVPRAVAAEGGTVWGPDAATLTRGALDEAIGLGLLVNPWTVNDPAEMARLFDWGATALTTDYPDVARDQMRERGFTLA